MLLTETIIEQRKEPTKHEQGSIYKELQEQYLKSQHLKANAKLYSCLSTDDVEEQKEGKSGVRCRGERCSEQPHHSQPRHPEGNDQAP